VQRCAHVALILARISAPLVLAWARGDSAQREESRPILWRSRARKARGTGVTTRLLESIGGGGTESQTLFDSGSAPFDDEDPSLPSASLPSLTTPPPSPLSPKQARSHSSCKQPSPPLIPEREAPRASRRRRGGDPVERTSARSSRSRSRSNTIALEEISQVWVFFRNAQERRVSSLAEPNPKRALDLQAQGGMTQMPES
jgi:hypothetical protein